jgi:hypothetical protein
VLVYREGESPESAYEKIVEPEEDAFAELIEELDADEMDEESSAELELAPLEMAASGGTQREMQDELEAQGEGDAGSEAEELADEA